MPAPLPIPPITAAKPIEFRLRGDFLRWLSEAGGTLAVTTYNTGKLALFRAGDGQLAASFWHFPRPMGLASNGQQLALATQQHLWLFRRRAPATAKDAQHFRPPASTELHRTLPDFALTAIFATGRLDAHDVAFDHRGVLFANTRFNCISRPSTRASFGRTWTPPFIQSRTRGDRCHLNGVGIRSGYLAMATAFCTTDAPEAWRGDNRFHSGVCIDVRQGTPVLDGLCMPHSPRWHAGRWWFCDSGRGALCSIDHRTSLAQLVAALPGFTRGLAFAAGRAIVGLSRIRTKHILDASPVRDRFPRTRSGLWLIDPISGDNSGSLEFLRGGREVYDVVHLPEHAASDAEPA